MLGNGTRHLLAFFILCLIPATSGAGATESGGYAVFDVYLFEASNADSVIGYPIFPGEVAVQMLDDILRSADEYERTLRGLYQFSSYALLGTVQIAVPIGRRGGTELWWTRVTDRFAVGFRAMSETPSSLLPFSVKLLRVEEGSPKALPRHPGVVVVIEGEVEASDLLISTQLFARSGKSVVLGRLMDGEGRPRQALFLVVAPSVYGDEEIRRLRTAGRQARISEELLTDERLVLFWHNLRGQERSRPEKAMQTLRAKLDSERARKEATFVSYDSPPKPKGGFAAIQRLLKYPKWAKEKGFQGRGIYYVLIDSTGQVTRTRVLKSAGLVEFDEAAQAAIRGVEWQPALQKDRPVEVWVAIPVIFRLDEDAKK
jgi:TonB family protein